MIHLPSHCIVEADAELLKRIALFSRSLSPKLKLLLEELLKSENLSFGTMEETRRILVGIENFAELCPLCPANVTMDRVGTGKCLTGHLWGKLSAVSAKILLLQRFSPHLNAV